MNKILFCFVIAASLLFLMSACNTSSLPTEPSELVTVNPGNYVGSNGVPSPDEVTYSDYYFRMTAEEQAAFISSFDSYEDFFVWHTAAKEAYEENRQEWDGSSPIDLSP